MFRDYMKVHSVNNQYINHKGLKISYQAEHKLLNADPLLISALFKTGKEHEGNQYIDILVLKNLAYRIKEKANPFFRIKEPYYLNKVSDTKLNIDAVYDGINDEVHLKGDKINIGIDFDTPQEMNDTIRQFNFMNGLHRVSFVAKLIENQFVRTKSAPLPTNGNRAAVVTLLMDKYSDIIV